MLLRLGPIERPWVRASLDVDHVEVVARTLTPTLTLSLTLTLTQVRASLDVDHVEVVAREAQLASLTT